MFCFLLQLSELCFNDFLRSIWSLDAFEHLGGHLLSSLHVCTVSIGSFDAKAVLFLDSNASAVLHFREGTIGAINLSEAKNAFDNPSEAAPLWKDLATWASKISSITS